MSWRALFEKDAVILLRGLRISIYLILISVLAFLYVISLSGQFNYSFPSKNVIDGGFYILLVIILSISMFSSDTSSRGVGDFEHHLLLLIPKRNISILASKMMIPPIFYLVGIALFTTILFSISNNLAFLKLWGVRLLVDTLLFFVLLSFSLILFLFLRSNYALIVSTVTLLILFILSPYVLNILPEHPNPIGCEYEILNDMSDGLINNFTPIMTLILYLMTFLSIMILKFHRMEVKE
ncbi:MAG: hypothetical protein QW379_09485 [Thermoplasmata archaeon]